MSPGIWSNVVGQVISIVLKDCGVFLFLEEAGFFEISRKVSPVTQYHIPEDFVLQLSCQYTVMRRLTTEIRSEICIVRRFRCRANVIECTYTNLDSAA